jgi:hypothetical protein
MKLTSTPIPDISIQHINTYYGKNVVSAWVHVLFKFSKYSHQWQPRVMLVEVDSMLIGRREIQDITLESRINLTMQATEDLMAYANDEQPSQTLDTAEFDKIKRNEYVKMNVKT